MKLARSLLWVPVGMLCLWGGWAAGQESTGRITGTVAKDGKGIGGVTVLVGGTRLAEVTEADGKFTIEEVPAGSYTLVFTYGEQSANQDVSIIAGETTEVELDVDWTVQLYETLTVYSASRRIEKIVDAPSAVTVVPSEQISREASHGQVPKVLEFTPGAEVTQSGLYDFNFNTRGFNSSLNRRVAAYIDGRDTAAPFLGAQEWSAFSFPLDDLASMEFVRGPSAALFGANSSSGVLNMTTKAPRDSQGGLARVTVGELSTDNLDVRWADEIGAGWYFKLTGSIRDTGDFSSPRNGVCSGGADDNKACNDDEDCEGAGVCLLPEPEYSTNCVEITDVDCLHVEATPFVLTADNVYSTGARFDKYFTDDNVMTIEAGYANIEGPVFQSGIGRIQTVDAKRPWGRLGFASPHWNVLGYYSRRDAEQKSLQSTKGLFTDTKKLSVEFQSNWDFAGGKGRIVFGGAHTEEDIDTSDPNTGQQSLLLDPVESDRQALFGQLDYKINDKVKLVFAGREDWNTLHPAQFSPKAAVVYHIKPNHTLRFTYNEAFQVANYSEFFLYAELTEIDDFAFLEATCNSVGVECGFELLPVYAVGNKDLTIEETQGWEIGYSGVLRNKAFLTIDYYNTTNEQFITDLLPQIGTPLGEAENNIQCTAPGLPHACCTGLKEGTCQPLNTNVPIWQGPPEWDEIIIPFLEISLNQSLSNSFSFLGGSNGVQFSNGPDGETIIVARSYQNFGNVDTQGVDIGLNYFITRSLGLQFTYSWFDFEPKEDDPELKTLLLPNTPENKFSIGVSYQRAKWDVGVSGRWVDDFRWSAGIFAGDVPSYNTVDLRGNYVLADHWKLGFNVSNAFDNEDFQAFGGDILGRRALASLTYLW